MPSPKTASKEEVKEAKTQRCEVLRAIGVNATDATVKMWKDRSDMKGINFVRAGLTTMIYPNKRKLGSDGKTWIEAEPVFVDLEIEVARKLSKAGAVRVDI